MPILMSNIVSTVSLRAARSLMTKGESILQPCTPKMHRDSNNICTRPLVPMLTPRSLRRFPTVAPDTFDAIIDGLFEFPRTFLVPSFAGEGFPNASTLSQRDRGQ